MTLNSVDNGKMNKNPRGIYSLLDMVADNDHIKLDNIEIKAYVSL